MTRVGIWSVGRYLPDLVRANDAWPREVVEEWQRSAIRGEARRAAQRGERELSDAAGLVLELQSRLQEDPFRGARERRVMPEGMDSSEMEVRAAKDALERAGVEPAEIDVLLTHSAIPDYLATNTACAVHHALGLPRRCFTLSTEAACNSFHLQLALASELVAGGRYRLALCVQSCAASRVLPYDQAYSTMFGDGATAVVVGRVGGERGILGQCHRTDGSVANTLVAGVPGKRWYDEGRATLYSVNLPGAYELFLRSADIAREVGEIALGEAGVRPRDIRFYASHQGTCWFREATQRALGLEHAASVDTYPWAGSLFGANVPLVLSVAEQEGTLCEDDLVLAFSGGSGFTMSASVIGWGR